jgi:AraC-like DNA-binding protein
LEDILEYRHSPATPGVSVLHAHYTERNWLVVNSSYGLAVPGSWVGELAYRGHRQVFGAGEVFCTEPGEVHSTSRILRPGDFRVLVIDAAPLAERLAEIAPALKVPHFARAGQRLSPTLRERIVAAANAIQPDSTPLAAQSAVMELVIAIAGELLENPRVPSEAAEASPALERVRECLHDGDKGWIDLDTLAQQAGISRFHLLRSFKKRYGLPPHAYQVALRVAKAQQLLRRGFALAEVAAECGFTDQSHFTRHFKQALGVPPGRFARDIAGAG